jgi:uncharacterized membrane protein
MKPITKKIIKQFLISFLVYAIIFSGLDCLKEGEFKLSKFLIQGLIFGLFIAIYNWYEHKKMNLIRRINRNEPPCIKVFTSSPSRSARLSPCPYARLL